MDIGDDASVVLSSNVERRKRGVEAQCPFQPFPPSTCMLFLSRSSSTRDALEARRLMRWPPQAWRTTTCCGSPAAAVPERLGAVGKAFPGRPDCCTRPCAMARYTARCTGKVKVKCPAPRRRAGQGERARRCTGLARRGRGRGCGRPTRRTRRCSCDLKIKLL